MNKALFWDFHGTLIHPDKVWSKSIHRAILARWPDRPLTAEQVSACQNQGAGIFPWDHPETDYHHLTEPASWWAHMNGHFHRICRCCGLSDGEARAVVPAIRGLILDPGNFRLYADARATLSRLEEDGWRHYILSNNFPDLPELCRALGIADCFADIIVSARTGYEKPRREIFELARQRAGWPERCVMIGDNPVADIVGAHTAGMTGVLVHPNAQRWNTAGTFPAIAPAHVCDQLAELVELLRGPAFT